LVNLFGYGTLSGSGGWINVGCDASNQWQVAWHNGTDAATYNSSTVVATGEWVRVELRVKVAAGAADEVELKINGTSVITQTGLSRTDSWPYDCLAIGYLGSGGVYLDDIAENDDQGSFQNSWPGSGRVVLLVPTSDSQRGSWTGGVGGTTNLWEAVNNKPPIGTASETDTSQIESVDTSGDNATDEYRGTLQAPTAVGVSSVLDALVLAQVSVWHGEDSSTGTKTGSVGFQASPVQASWDTFTYGNGSALGTWPTNWSMTIGTAQDLTGQSVSATPVLAVRKTDANAEVVSICAFGAYVEFYEPPGGIAVHFIGSGL